jgi:hypothetical protein
VWYSPDISGYAAFDSLPTRDNTGVDNGVDWTRTTDKLWDFKALTQFSYGVNAGLAAHYSGYGNKDIEGKARVSTPDMGVYESDFSFGISSGWE